MYGLLLVELHKYIAENLGAEAWQEIIKEAGLGVKIYTANQEYPDQEAATLLSATSMKTGQSFPEFLEDYGTFLASDLLKIYGVSIDPRWKTLDLLENIDEIVHFFVRTKRDGANPPELRAKRVNSGELIVTYNSPRKLCALARGLINGIAKYYDESVLVTETACAEKGANACEISVKLLK